MKENKTAFREHPDKKGESAEEMFNRQRNEAEREIERLKTEHRSKAGRIWDIKKKIIGGKKTATQATAIVNPTTTKTGGFEGENKRDKFEVLYCSTVGTLYKQRS